MDLNELRNEARRMHRNATRKGSRMRAQGYEVSGTKNDPRRELGKVKKYNTKQAQAYIDNLKKFNSRSVGYVKSGGDEPFTRSQWSNYKRQENRYNKIASRYNETFKNVKLPNQTMTIGQRDEMKTANRKQAFGTPTNDPYATIKKRSASIKSPRALAALAQDMGRKLKSGYLTEKVATQRQQYMQMLEKMGDSELMKKSEQMSEGQFAIAWNHGKLAESTAARYVAGDIEIGSASGQIEDDNGADSRDIVDWALELDY